jgi:N-acetylglucosaminyldiphosphoundecaprenol N-acetyl-beta-D-mannosaminyltransferase
LSAQLKAPASRSVLGMRVDATSYEDATQRIITWANAGGSRTVAVAAVNNVMMAYDDREFMTIMNDADLVTADGMPLVWGLRMLGVPSASRVYGPELTPVVLGRAADEGIPVALVGGTPSVLDALMRCFAEGYPGLQVAYRFSPPFRPMMPEEDQQLVREIEASGARIVFVGLGCPKQERWMAQHRGQISGVMVGVGAAFDFLAGVKPQAPPFMRRAGLEWIFRLATEPRRLWRRYLQQNPRFVALFARQVIAERMARRVERRSDRQEVR